MPQPTSLRLPDDVKERLDAAAGRAQSSASALAVRLLDEGLRMADHPGIVFHDSPARGRVAALAGGPDVAEVVGVLQGLESRGEERVQELADWFGIHPSRVRVAVGYWAAFREEVDGEVALRARVAAEARGRYEAEQALLE